MNHHVHHDHDESRYHVELQDPTIERRARVLFDCAFSIHRQYGPGLLESAYEKILAHELNKKGISVSCQQLLPIHHDGLVIDAGYRLDMVLDELVIVELKCVEKLQPIHEAQLITYLKLSGIKLGFLINFHEKLLKNGIRRFVV